jgi:1-acyl-sn-glycerol-3-phosphate acyltransferase
MTTAQRILVALARGITGSICRIDDAQLAQVPYQGPLIIVTNHTNILEIPIIYSRLQPRAVHGLVLAARWENPILGWMLNVCQTIPLQRGEADFSAIRRALNYLQAGHILIISPEGTRSGDGLLQCAHPGVVSLALHSHAPLLPIVYSGAEKYKENLARLRRTDFHLSVGKSFYLDARGSKVTRQVRKQMIDEIMYQLAALLPQAKRGIYSDLSTSTSDYLIFP